MTPIRKQIEDVLRQARLNRDEATKNVVGMLKNKVMMELKSGSGRDESDELWLEVLSGYAKQSRKTIGEYEKLGGAGQSHLKEAKFELEFCERFLPKKLDEAQTEQIVRGLIEEHKINDIKMMGKLMGLLMKNHRDVMDGDLARRCAERILTGQS